MNEPTNEQIAIGSMLRYVDKTIRDLTYASSQLGSDLLQRENINTRGIIKITCDKRGVTKQLKFTITVDLD